MPEPPSAVCTCAAPDWVVTEQWAILGEDGDIDMVPFSTRRDAERHLQARRDGGPGRPGEPGARLMSRLSIAGPTTGRPQATAWIGRSTPGDPPSPVPAFLRGGYTC